MKRILCVVLLLLTMLPLLAFPTSARIIEGGIALDKVAVLEDYNKSAISGNFTEEERKEIAEGFGLAEHYKIEYKIDTNEKTLEIYCGTDENGNMIKQNMLPYARRDWVPWQGVQAQMDIIRTVVLHEGVGSLGRYTFWGCENLKTVYLPHSVKKIDRTALYQCNKLETVYYAGNKADFLENVIYDEVRNWGEDEDGNVVFTMMDKMHFGESVTVECVNQEGELIRTYTVGGYFAGDSYSIYPEEYEGLVYEGDKFEIIGTFKENDDTVHRLTYRCEHEYIVPDPTKPCNSYCKYCYRDNPEPPAEHEWGEPEITAQRGFLTAENGKVTCLVCGAKESIYRHPIVLWVAIAAGSAVLVTAVTLAIVIPIRRKKRVKEMTW